MTPDSGQPDTSVSVREKFAIDSDMMVPAFGQSTVQQRSKQLE